MFLLQCFDSDLVLLLRRSNETGRTRRAPLCGGPGCSQSLISSAKTKNSQAHAERKGLWLGNSMAPSLLLNRWPLTEKYEAFIARKWFFYDFIVACGRSSLARIHVIWGFLVTDLYLIWDNLPAPEGPPKFQQQNLQRESPYVELWRTNFQTQGLPQIKRLKERLVDMLWIVVRSLDGSADYVLLAVKEAARGRIFL